MGLDAGWARRRLVRAVGWCGAIDLSRLRLTTAGLGVTKLYNKSALNSMNCVWIGDILTRLSDIDTDRPPLDLRTTPVQSLPQRVLRRELCVAETLRFAYRILDDPDARRLEVLEELADFFVDIVVKGQVTDERCEWRSGGQGELFALLGSTRERGCTCCQLLALPRRLGSGSSQGREERSGIESRYPGSPRLGAEGSRGAAARYKC